MTSKEEAKQKIKRLIDLYEKYQSTGQINNFRGKEDNTKSTFIEPFFEALGWDVKNQEDIEMLKEEPILKGAVDYAFLIKGQYKFFVEAKPIGKDLKDVKSLKEAAEQSIRYGVNSNNKYVVLTNFEWLVIFNCELKGQLWEKWLFEPMSYKDYLTNFEQIWLLSKEGALKNELDVRAGKIGKRVPRTPVDKELLQKFLKWREKLSKDLKKYPEEEIDEFVQKLLVRLLFIRNCEDRGFETVHTLWSASQFYQIHKRGLLKLLRGIFKYYDIYNGSIFKESEIDSIEFNEALLAEVINGLYVSEDEVKYDFNIIPADVMGNLYEQYLGHILKKTPQQAKLKEGKAHRKEQGIYYTPTYIVEYIVRNTLGELLKNKKVDASKIRVLDPACGSGSFLIKAFQSVDDYYRNKETESIQIKLDTAQDLKYSKKVEILKNNIFGVDLDQKAIEIARLNLLLQIVEKEERLPLLEKNIKLGNSLIDDPEIAGAKAFKWGEQFKEVMQKGGFDVVIGNPPYINVYLLSRNVEEMKYYQSNYFSAYKKFDLYVLFIEKAIKLLKNGGVFSFIIPDKFLSQPYGQRLRKFILENCIILKIVDLTAYKIFEQATVDNIILVLKKENDSKLRDKNSIQIIKPLNDPSTSKKIEEDIFKLSQETFLEDKENLFRIDINPKKLRLKEKIEKDSIFIRDICYVNWGARSGDIKTFVVKEKKNDLCKPMLDGRDINRYRINYDDKFLIYDEEKLYNPMFKELFENPKLMIRDVNAREGLRATYDEDSYYAEHTLSICMPFHQLKGIKRRGLKLTNEQINNSKRFNLKYILGILNSKLITFYFKTFIGCGLHVYPDNIRALPIKTIPESQQQPLIKLVDKMLSLNKRLNEIGDKKTDERIKIEEEIRKTDAEIDELVYKIYGITEKEKKIIGKSLK